MLVMKWEIIFFRGNVWNGYYYRIILYFLWVKLKVLDKNYGKIIWMIFKKKLLYIYLVYVCLMCVWRYKNEIEFEILEEY